MAGAAARAVPVDWNFRPTSYWDSAGAIFANIKGTWRRRWLARVAAGQSEDIPAAFAGDELSDPTRTIAGRVHPQMMGGEYLPSYRPEEIEIARVELDSTTADVVSIRARPCGGRIAYRVLDEYGARFWLPRHTSRRPLTLAQLVEIIDGAVPDYDPDVSRWTGLVIPHNRESLAADWGEDPPQLRNARPDHEWIVAYEAAIGEACGFAVPSSEFYPELRTLYELRSRAFVRHHRIDLSVLAPEEGACPGAGSHRRPALPGDAWFCGNDDQGEVR